MTIRLQIIQQVLAPYRVPLFNRIAADPEITLNVGFHEDWTDGAYERTLLADHTRLGTRKIGPIRTLTDWDTNADVLVLPLNLKLTNTFLALKKSARRPAICFWGHGYGKLKLLNPITSMLARRVEAIIAYAAAGKQRMIDKGIAGEKIFVCNNTLDVTNHGLDQTTKKTDFLYVGRLQSRKRIDELMVAFQTLAASFPEIRLTIIGEGDIRSELESRSAELGIAERTEFTGKIFDNEILKTYFAKAIAYVSPGPVGLGVVHSFAFGTPVITDATIVHGPESNYLRHQENALLFQASVSELMAAMRSLLVDPALMEQLALNAYQTFVDECDMRHSVAAFVQAVQHAHRVRSGNSE
ncbi:MAG: glycosyltransferase [Planctomycetota bacterium]